MNADVRLAAVTKRFGSVTAVRAVSLDVAQGEVLALLGPSGCGKTTTLRLVAGFEAPDSGTVEIRGRVVNDVPTYRRNLGMVFQQYALFPHMSVFDNVAFGLRMRGVARAEARRRVSEAMALVRLQGLEGRFPAELSGGQQQRVALARAVVTRPAVLLLDEPLGALDKKLREHMQIEIRTLHALARRVLLDAGEGSNVAADRLPLLRAARRRHLAVDGTAALPDAAQLDTMLSAWKVEGRAPPPEVEPALRIYEDLLRARGAVDFDDLVVRAGELLETDPALRLRWPKAPRS